MKKNHQIILILLSLSLNGCVTIQTVKDESFIFKHNEKIEVVCPYDNLEIKPELEEELKNIGFSITDSLNADLYFKLSYDYYFDVFHNTSNLINLIVMNKKSEIILTSGFTGDTPYSSSGLVQRMVSDISKKLKQANH